MCCLCDSPRLSHRREAAGAPLWPPFRRLLSRVQDNRGLLLMKPELSKPSHCPPQEGAATPHVTDDKMKSEEMRLPQLWHTQPASSGEMWACEAPSHPLRDTAEAGACAFKPVLLLAPRPPEHTRMSHSGLCPVLQHAIPLMASACFLHPIPPMVAYQWTEEVSHSIFQHVHPIPLPQSHRGLTTP